MALYYFIWGLSMVVMAYPPKRTGQYRIQLFVCFLLLFLFGAFRYDFGLDYSAYETIFDMASNDRGFDYNPEERIETGYLYLNYLCPSFRFLIIITSLLVAVAYYVLFDRYVPVRHRVVAIFLLYLSGNNTVFFMFSGMRNSIAICLLLLSIPLIEKRKIIWYAAVMMLAGSMHASSFLIFPVAYLMGYIKEINKRVSTWLIVISVVLCCIPISVLISLSGDFIANNMDRYSGYIESAEEIGRGASLLVTIANLALIILVTKSVAGYKLSRRQNIIVLLGLLSLITPLLGPLDMRLSIFFSAISIPCVLIAYDCLKDIRLKYLLLGLFTAYRAYSFFIVFINSQYFAYDNIHNLILDL